MFYYETYSFSTMIQSNHCMLFVFITVETKLTLNDFAIIQIISDNLLHLKYFASLRHQKEKKKLTLSMFYQRVFAMKIITVYFTIRTS